MATQLQLRRDTAADLGSATPVVGEPGVDTDNKRLVIGDGVRAGGIPHVNFLDLQSQDFTYCTVGGTADAITLAVSATEASLEAYVAGTSLWFKATADNTGAVTFNVDGLGVKNGKKFVDGAVVDLEADDIRSGGLYHIVYDGTQFIAQLAGGGAAGGTVIASGSLPASNLIDFTSIPDTFAMIKLTIKAATMDVSGRTVQVEFDTGLGLGDSTTRQYVMKIDGTTITRVTGFTALPAPDVQSTAQFASIEVMFPGYAGDGIKRYTARHSVANTANEFSNDILYDGVLSLSTGILRFGAVEGIRVNTDAGGTNFDGGTYLLEGFN